LLKPFAAGAAPTLSLGAVGAFQNRKTVFDSRGLFGRLQGDVFASTDLAILRCDTLISQRLAGSAARPNSAFASS